MAFETISYDFAQGVATVTLNRPKVLNALNRQMITELGQVFAQTQEDDAVKIVILTGSGDKAFAAGADIGELAKAKGLKAVDLARRGQKLTRDMEHLGKPIIAAVNGYAFGGGCEIAMACTIRIAGSNAVFGQPEVNLGIIPGYGGTQRLTRLVGKGVAMDLVLTGRNLSAEDALRVGLVTQVVEPEALMESANKLAGTLMKKGPIALRLTMEAVNAGESLGMDDALALEAHYFGVCAATQDCREGLQAFIEKRKPDFKGN